MRFDLIFSLSTDQATSYLINRWNLNHGSVIKETAFDQLFDYN